MRRLPPILVAATLILWAVHGRAAPGDGAHVAVVDLSDQHADPRLVAQVEREILRLRPGSRILDEPAMRTLLGTGEGPAAAAIRIAHEAVAKQADGRCADAVASAELAESLALGNLPFDDERDLLKDIYVVLVTCEAERGRTKELGAAAARLRALTSLRPDPLAVDLWNNHVDKALPGPAEVELQIDSEPANAQVQIDFHGDGTTPRTLKVSPGLHYIEVQKDGFHKAFRRINLGKQPMRTAFRLVERTRDRLDQAQATLGALRNVDPARRAPGLAKLAQLSRADLLVVLVATAANQVRLWFFDSERGGLAKEAIDSPFDPSNFNVAILAAMPTPGASPAPNGEKKRPLASPPTAPAASTDLPEAQAQAASSRKLVRPGPPWWGWLVAATVLATLAVVVVADRPKQPTTFDVHAHWNGP